MNSKVVKKKIINDPVYGFISIDSELVFGLIEHPYFQRLRRITQLGLTNVVYPAANHTRFQHALGATHLMQKAIQVLRSKGIDISEKESEAAMIAILLHDIGHGPYSHALENSIVKNVGHESISDLLMQKLNEEFDGKLDMAISIFRGDYPKSFLHQLVSSQLDMDRLDYLKRDSFFTGVSEGVIGSDRIISMLNVVNGDLVVEKKGIYSIEKFIVARRLMYWQVYLHKTVICAEFLLLKVLKRARHLAKEGHKLPANRSLLFFLKSNFQIEDFKTNKEVIHEFTKLDDYDVLGAIKNWASYPDTVLSLLCQSIVDRKLFKTEIQNEAFDEKRLQELQEKFSSYYKLPKELSSYFIFTDSIENLAYTIESEKINILKKNSEVVEISKAADLFTFASLSDKVEKHFLCYPRVLFA